MAVHHVSISVNILGVTDFETDHENKVFKL
jgi:hypothetical protein